MTWNAALDIRQARADLPCAEIRALTSHQPKRAQQSISALAGMLDRVKGALLKHNILPVKSVTGFRDQMFEIVTQNNNVLMRHLGRSHLAEQFQCGTQSFYLHTACHVERRPLPCVSDLIRESGDAVKDSFNRPQDLSLIRIAPIDFDCAIAMVLAVRDKKCGGYRAYGAYRLSPSGRFIRPKPGTDFSEKENRPQKSQHAYSDDKNRMYKTGDSRLHVSPQEKEGS